MKSKLYQEEIVNNEERKFGEDTEYFPCKIVDRNGQEVPALFTSSQIRTAIRRAAKNPEDIPESPTLWAAIFGG